MKSFVLAALIGATAASMQLSIPEFFESLKTDSRCPGSPAMIHAKTQIQTEFTNSCSDVIAVVTTRAQGSTDGSWTDPHNGGKYTITDSSATSMSFSHLTGNGLYTDLVKFTFSDSQNGGCSLFACSESQVTSVLDYSTNYCNSHDLYCGDEKCHLGSLPVLKYSEKISASSGEESTTDCYSK